MEISIPLITAFFGLLGMSFGAATLSQPPAHRYAAVVAVGGYEDPWQHLNTAISAGNAVRSLLQDALGFQDGGLDSANRRLFWPFGNVFRCGDLVATTRPSLCRRCRCGRV